MKKDDDSAAASIVDLTALNLPSSLQEAMSAAAEEAARQDAEMEEAFSTPQQQQGVQSPAAMDTENVRSALKRDRDDSNEALDRLRGSTRSHIDGEGYTGIGPSFSGEIDPDL